MTEDNGNNPSNNDFPRNSQGRFLPGNAYGKGRPAGSRNKATLAAEALLEGEAEALAKKVIELALTGEVSALKIAFERLVPPRKSRAIQLQLPPIHSAQDIKEALAITVAAAADGDISLDEALTLSNILEIKRRSIDTVELEERLSALEAKDEKL